MTPGTTWALLRALLPRPALWPSAAAEAFRLRPDGWWRRWPPLPVPSTELWRFRMVTAYGGDGDAVPGTEDVVAFVRWCRDMRRWRKRTLDSE